MPEDVSTSPAPNAPEDDEKESKIEEVARAGFGLRRWDRPSLYRETAEAGTDTDFAFWAVLLLSGAIATLGLALDATAVVIGAMLIAPLLGPLLGLSLALAIGDGRLAAQTFATLVLGMIGVIAVAALLTVALPFQSITSEIAARTRPTTLDLAIAVSSGLAGAVVTITREQRLSASIPGVAIAVALIPPLGVAGFGIGTGWKWEIIQGSLLLFGANLGGIVLSGMLAFLLVGMHRPDVLAEARRWHREGKRYGLAARIEQARAFRGLQVFASPWARVALVLTFVGAVAVPLTTSLRQIVRETRVESAIDAAERALIDGGRVSILSSVVDVGDRSTSARFRIATTNWIEDAQRQALETSATAAAGEPVRIGLEQVIVTDDEVDALGDAPPASGGGMLAEEASIERLRGPMTSMLRGLVVPDSVYPLAAEVAIGRGPVRVQLVYAAPAPLPAAAESMLIRQAAQALGLAPAFVYTEAVVLAPRPLPVDSLEAAGMAPLLDRFPDLLLILTADSAAAGPARQAFEGVGVAADRIIVRPGSPPRVRLALPEERD